MRIAAVGDLHIGADGSDLLGDGFSGIEEHADVLLLAGDLTRHGTVAEASRLAERLRAVPIPIVAVLGNHDHHSDSADAVAGVLVDIGVAMLDGDAASLDVGQMRLGVAGAKGFGGGFATATVAPFGEPEMKAFSAHAHDEAQRLRTAFDALATMSCDIRIALTHYSPVADTLVGEQRELYAFLGSQLLAEAIDEARCDLAVHGHAHGGSECGRTPGGTPVRNVALPVLRSPYRVYTLNALPV